MKLKDQDKKEAIYAETLNIVFSKGIAGIKMADLAKRVGISPSTLYVYHKNKEELIVSLFTDLIQAHTIAFRSHLDADIPYKHKLKKIWLQWLQFSIDNHKEMNFMKQFKRSPYMEHISESVKADKQKMGDDLLNQGKAQLMIKNVPNNILHSVIEANMLQTTTMIMEKQISLNEQDTDMMFNFLWDAIKA